MDKRIKCTACKRVKFEEDFRKNQKLLKTCLSCREKHSKKGLSLSEVPVEAPVEVPKEVPVEVPKEVPVQVPVEVPKEVPVQVPKEVPVEAPQRNPTWIGLSGYWIHPGDERKIHKKLLRKVNRQFQQHCSFPVHQYLSRSWMVDIRDRYSPSAEGV